MGRVDGDAVQALGISYALQRGPAAPQLPPKLFDRMTGGDLGHG
ncbi:hypothetical protein ACPZ19_38415 [Amycolatopsis lurida]